MLRSSALSWTAFTLAAALALPPQAWALRAQQMDRKTQRTGLEEALGHDPPGIAPPRDSVSTGLEEVATADLDSGRLFARPDDSTVYYVTQPSSEDSISGIWVNLESYSRPSQPTASERTNLDQLTRDGYRPLRGWESAALRWISIAIRYAREVSPPSKPESSPDPSAAQPAVSVSTESNFAGSLSQQPVGPPAPSSAIADTASLISEQSDDFKLSPAASHSGSQSAGLPRESVPFEAFDLFQKMQLAGVWGVLEEVQRLLISGSSNPWTVHARLGEAIGKADPARHPALPPGTLEADWEMTSPPEPVLESGHPADFQQLFVETHRGRFKPAEITPFLRNALAFVSQGGIVEEQTRRETQTRARTATAVLLGAVALALGSAAAFYWAAAGLEETVGALITRWRPEILLGDYLVIPLPDPAASNQFHPALFPVVRTYRDGTFDLDRPFWLPGTAGPIPADLPPRLDEFRTRRMARTAGARRIPGWAAAAFRNTIEMEKALDRLRQWHTEQAAKFDQELGQFQRILAAVSNAGAAVSAEDWAKALKNLYGRARTLVAFFLGDTPSSSQGHAAAQEIQENLRQAIARNADGNDFQPLLFQVKEKTPDLRYLPRYSREAETDIRTQIAAVRSELFSSNPQPAVVRQRTVRLRASTRSQTPALSFHGDPLREIEFHAQRGEELEQAKRAGRIRGMLQGAAIATAATAGALALSGALWHFARSGERIPPAAPPIAAESRTGIGPALPGTPPAVKPAGGTERIAQVQRGEGPVRFVTPTAVLGGGQVLRLQLSSALENLFRGKYVAAYAGSARGGNSVFIRQGINPFVDGKGGILMFGAAPGTKWDLGAAFLVVTGTKEEAAQLPQEVPDTLDSQVWGAAQFIFRTLPVSAPEHPQEIEFLPRPQPGQPLRIPFGPGKGRLSPSVGTGPLDLPVADRVDPFRSALAELDAGRRLEFAPALETESATVVDFTGNPALSTLAAYLPRGGGIVLLDSLDTMRKVHALTGRDLSRDLGLTVVDASATGYAEAVRQALAALRGTSAIFFVSTQPGSVAEPALKAAAFSLGIPVPALKIVDSATALLRHWGAVASDVRDRLVEILQDLDAVFRYL